MTYYEVNRSLSRCHFRSSSNTQKIENIKPSEKVSVDVISEVALIHDEIPIYDASEGSQSMSFQK